MTEEDPYVRLSQLYYNPNTGISSVASLVRKAAENDIRLTAKQVKEWYEKQALAQLFEPKNKKFLFHIYAYDFGYLISDLIDVQKFAKSNKGYKFILVIMDLKSRFAWMFGLKNKMPTQILPHLESVVSYMEQQREELSRLNLRPITFPIVLITDSGSEYKGAVAKYLKNKGIRHVVGNPADNTKRRTANVERLNRTILNKMRRIFALTKSTNWIDYLADIVKNYNDSYHISIKAKPIDVIEGRAKTGETRRKNKPPVFEPGDRVRYELPLGEFDKRGRVLRYSEEVYTVEQKIGNLYLLNNQNFYLPDQLKKIAGNEMPIKVNEAIVQANKAARTNRRARKEVAVGHEAHVVDGNVQLKERLQPAQAKRAVRAPKR